MHPWKSRKITSRYGDQGYYYYEWVVEYLEENGEIAEVEHYEINKFPGLPITGRQDVALRRINGTKDFEGNDQGGDFSYAYLDADGKCEATWDQTTEKVPSKWIKFVKKCVNKQEESN
jgi:hypothetical protein